MFAGPLDGPRYGKAAELEGDPLESEGVQCDAGSDHAEWFLVGLIIFGLVAELAIVLNTVSAAL